LVNEARIRQCRTHNCMVAIPPQSNKITKILRIGKNVPHKAVETKAPMSITPAYGPMSNAGRQARNAESKLEAMRKRRGNEWEGKSQGRNRASNSDYPHTNYVCHSPPQPVSNDGRYVLYGSLQRCSDPLAREAIVDCISVMILPK
jgi:hypothetical protein